MINTFKENDNRSSIDSILQNKDDSSFKGVPKKPSISLPDFKKKTCRIIIFIIF